MDLQPLLSSAAVAAIVSGIVGYGGTRATLHANRKKDRFDRLFLLFRDMRAKLQIAKMNQIESFAAIKAHDGEPAVVDDVAKYQKSLDDAVLIFVSEKVLFDNDIKAGLDLVFADLLEASRQRTLDSNAPDEIKHYGFELVKKEEFFAKMTLAVDEQLGRLREI